MFIHASDATTGCATANRAFAIGGRVCKRYAMTILSDIRTRIRKDLRDTDSLAYRWTDVQLDRHIERALNELSIAIPQEKLATIASDWHDESDRLLQDNRA